MVQAAKEARSVSARSADPPVHPEQKPATPACLKAGQLPQAWDWPAWVLTDHCHPEAGIVAGDRGEGGVETFDLAGDEGS